MTLFGDRLLRVDLEAKVALPTLTLSALGADTTLYSRGRLAFAPSGKGLAFGWGGDVVGLDYPSGRVRWRTPLPLTGSPRADGLAYAPAGDRGYATSSDPYALVALDGATGRVLDCETFAPKSAGPVAEAEPWVALAEFAAGGELVVVTRGGAVELRDLPNRAVRETRLPSGLWVASGMTPDGGDWRVSHFFTSSADRAYALVHQKTYLAARGSALRTEAIIIIERTNVTIGTNAPWIIFTLRITRRIRM